MKNLVKLSFIFILLSMCVSYVIGGITIRHEHHIKGWDSLTIHHKDMYPKYEFKDDSTRYDKNYGYVEKRKTFEGKYYWSKD